MIFWNVISFTPIWAIHIHTHKHLDTDMTCWYIPDRHDYVYSLKIKRHRFRKWYIYYHWEIKFLTVDMSFASLSRGTLFRNCQVTRTYAWKRLTFLHGMMRTVNLAVVTFRYDTFLIFFCLRLWISLQSEYDKYTSKDYFEPKQDFLCLRYHDFMMVEILRCVDYSTALIAFVSF